MFFSKEVQLWIPVFTADILALLPCRGGINKSSTLPFGWSRSGLQIIVPADTRWRKTGKLDHRLLMLGSDVFLSEIRD